MGPSRSKFGAFSTLVVGPFWGDQDQDVADLVAAGPALAEAPQLDPGRVDPIGRREGVAPGVDRAGRRRFDGRIDRGRLDRRRFDRGLHGRVHRQHRLELRGGRDDGVAEPR